jgi:hypothetical protein
VLLANIKNKIMKKYLISSIVLAILLSGVASAEGYSTSTNRIDEIKQKITDIKQKAAQEREGIKTELASTTEKLKDLRDEKRSELEMRIGKKLDQQKLKITNAFEMAIRNLKDLVSRIESRITKMEANGINASSSKILLDTAKAKVVLADTELTNLGNLIVQNIPTATSTKNAERKAILQSIKAQSEKTKAAIKVAHKSIVDVINSLKPGQMKEKDKRATSTKEVKEVSTSTSSTTNN